MNVKDLENEYGKMHVAKTEKGEAVIIDRLKKSDDENERETIAPPKF